MADSYAVTPETIERFGRLIRHFPVAVSAEAMALAWANQEEGPHGATVIVDHEIGPRGLHGRLWKVPQPQTLSLAVVLRPELAADAGEATWLVAGMAGLEGVEGATGRTFSALWPDSVVDPDSDDHPVASVRSEIQLGPGQVKCAVITVRVDLPSLGIDPDSTDELVGALVAAADRNAERLNGDLVGLGEAYSQRCQLVDRRVKVQLLPKGETRGTVARVDQFANLVLRSGSGMEERLGVSQLRNLVVL